MITIDISNVFNDLTPNEIQNFMFSEDIFVPQHQRIFAQYDIYIYIYVSIYIYIYIIYNFVYVLMWPTIGYVKPQVDSF